MHAKKFRFPDRVIKGKKAQAESQLNWIFILIVGAIIIAFFTFIVIKQRAASEAKFAGKVSTQLNTILVGAKVSSGTVQDIPTPDLEIRFTCNDYYIGPASQRLGNRVVFAPEFLEGNRLITWTLDWNVPFKATTFLYMATPLVRYVVVGTDQDAKDIFKALPSKLNKGSGTVTLAEYDILADENDKHVRFIFVNQGKSSFNIPLGLQNAEVSGLIVETAKGSQTTPAANKDTAQFLVKSTSGLITSGGKFEYLEPEILYGAIFSTRQDEYACLLERAYNRYNMVSQVYYEKFNEIAPVYKGTGCEGFYKNNPKLNSLITATKFDETKTEPVDYSTIKSVKKQLEEMNYRLQLQSCPLLY
jgi:hypothetical protein